MPSQGELLKRSIATLEPKYGADNPFVKGLRMQLIAFERQERRQNERDQFHLAVSQERQLRISSENQSPVEKQIVTLREQEDGIKMVKPRSNKD